VANSFEENDCENVNTYALGGVSTFIKEVKFER
jgi:hypothetical protein